MNMKMTLLPPRLERWITEKASRVFGREDANYGNGQWMFSPERENKAAFDAIIKNVWMYSAIYAISSSASSLPCGVYKRGTSTKGGDYQLDESDPVTVLFQKPNNIQTRSEFVEACFWSLELSGKLFIEVVGTKRNPKELYVLDPRRMKLKKDKDKYLAGYEYDLNGLPVLYTTEDIIFHRYHNPGDSYEGLSASTPAGDSINSDILSNQYNNEYFGNSAIPSAVLETERRMNEEECNLLRIQWEKGHKKKGKRHRTAILYGGVKFTVIQKSPKDMEFSKQKLLNREEILASYGVPPVLVGLLESVNYGNSKEQRKLFWQQTMKPKLRSFAERMTIDFGLDGAKRKFMLDLSDVEALQDDQEVKSRIAFNLQKSLTMTTDEVRRIFYKLPPLPDGTGATIWIPSNMVPAKLLMDGPISAPAGKPAGKPGNPSGPDTTPEPNGQKPGASDGKPAGKIAESVIAAVARHLIENEDDKKDWSNESLNCDKLIG